MKKLEYQVGFTTPAFLGNAEQRAQWRTPPFKALIRQWWRVVKAKEVGYAHRRLLQEENRLFGAAADDGGGSHRSLIRLRLDKWTSGDLVKWNADTKIPHKEVGKDVGAELYLGFGPLAYGDIGKANAKGFPIKDTVLSPIKSSATGLTRTAINTAADAKLSVLLPAELESQIHNSLQLAAWFGTLGSRSRNGWGAFQLSGENVESIGTLNPAKLEPFSRNLADCLQLEWPHAIGLDNSGPLIWKTPPMNSWREVMKDLARLKIAFRTQFSFDRPGINDRHILAYPVTHHTVSAWGNQTRLANQIRFKVAKFDEKYLGIIVHLPCRLPDELANKLHGLPSQLTVWQSVHKVLDQELGASSRLWRN